MKAKTIFKVLLVLILIIALNVIGITFYFLTHGKQILLSAVKSNLGVEATIGNFRIAFPSSLVLQDVSIGEDIKVARIDVSPSVMGFLKGDIAFDHLFLEQPLLKVTRRSDGSFDFGIPLPEEEEVAEPGAGTKKEAGGSAKQKLFYFNNLKISDGNILFSDEKISEGAPFAITLAHLDLAVSRLSVLDLFRMDVSGTGELITKTGQIAGKADISGWVNVISRSMDVKAEAKDMRLIYFGPYYKKFAKKKDLKSGDMLFTALARSKNNDMNVDCHVELSNIAFVELEVPEGSENKANISDIFSSMLTAGGSSVFDFSFRTRMDRPRFEKVKIKGNFFQTKINAAISDPGKTAEDFKKVGEEFKEIGKQFKEMFKKKTD